MGLGLGCAAEGPPPVLEAHRAGAGYWPPNSRTAVQGTLDEGFDGIEVDLVLTDDRVPVLSHDPWLDPDACTFVDDSPLDDRVLIRSLTLARLQADYRCGGLPDPMFPNALVVGDSVMSLDELTAALRGTPGALSVHLDIRQEPALTGPADVFAEQILSRWYAADLPQDLYVTSNRAEVLAAFELRARSEGRELTTSLIWPAYSVDGATTGAAIGAEAALVAGRIDYVDLVRDAGADGIAVQWQLVDRHRLSVARRAGIGLQLWTINDPSALSEWTRPGRVDAIITDFPGDQP